MSTMKRVFVSGTDTDVGKTVLSAWLAAQWPADYWKPAQSGTVDGSDSERVAQLAGARCHPEVWRLAAPLSPHRAAELEARELSLADVPEPPAAERLVIEGAGGLMVPLNGRELMIDLVARLKAPVLLAARSGLGTINHTLLSLQALRARGLPVLGVAMLGAPDAANRAAIEHHGRVRVLAELPRLEPLTPERLRAEPLPAALRRALDALPDVPQEA